MLLDRSLRQECPKEHWFVLGKTMCLRRWSMKLVVPFEDRRVAAGQRQAPPLSRDIVMKMRMIVVLASLLLSFGVCAQTRCSTDSFGNTTCRDSSGNSTRTTKDSFGNTTTRDSRGNTVRGTTDSLGNTTYRDNSGNSVRRTSDSFGNSTYRDNKGNAARSTTDSLGNTTYREPPRFS